MVLTKLLLFLLVEYTVCQYAPGVPPPRGRHGMVQHNSDRNFYFPESNDIKFHEPAGTPPPTKGKGQAPRQSSHRHHADIRLNLEKERE